MIKNDIKNRNKYIVNNEKNNNGITSTVSIFKCVCLTTRKLRMDFVDLLVK